MVSEPSFEESECQVSGCEQLLSSTVSVSSLSRRCWMEVLPVNE